MVEKNLSGSSPTSAHEFKSPSIDDLLKDRGAGENHITERMRLLQETGWIAWFEAEMERESQPSPVDAYPSQGLAQTAHDSRRALNAETIKLTPEQIADIIPAIIYYLELFNHSERLAALNDTPDFIPPQKIFSWLFFLASLKNEALAINELALTAGKYDEKRVSRTDTFRNGPFVMFGRQPRIQMVGSANPDCYGSAAAIAHMAESHALVGLPRDGVFTSIKRQADLAHKTLEWLENSPVLAGRSEEDQATLVELWRNNIMGVLEVNPKKAIIRAQALYDTGIRTFRAYSPEPGCDLVSTIKALRAHEKANNWDPIEIFAGQIVSVDQAKEAERAGADGLYLGIGGGGRCITGVRSGLAIDWPQLLWKLRGAVKIPIIVEGGASDQIAVTMALGGTGIGVSRKVAGGTVESPGGYTYYQDKDGLFKPYRGEASAATKANGGRVGPFGLVPNIEGEATEAEFDFGLNLQFTLLARLHQAMGDLSLGWVFQNVDTLDEFMQLAAKNLRRVGPAENALRKTH